MSSLEETEINIGGTKFKGIYIVILVSIISTASGGIWAFSEFVNRIALVEDKLASIEVPDLAPLNEQVKEITTQIRDNNVSQLAGKLAELGVTLKSIGDRQQEVLDNGAEVSAKVQELEKKFIEVQNSVETSNKKVVEFEEDVKVFKREVDDLWKGLDAAASPLG